MKIIQELTVVINVHLLNLAISPRKTTRKKIIIMQLDKKRSSLFIITVSAISSALWPGTNETHHNKISRYIMIFQWRFCCSQLALPLGPEPGDGKRHKTCLWLNRNEDRIRCKQHWLTIILQSNFFHNGIHSPSIQFFVRDNLQGKTILISVPLHRLKCSFVSRK